jgi:hypothetical protein
LELILGDLEEQISETASAEPNNPPHPNRRTPLGAGQPAGRFPKTCRARLWNTPHPALS